jgi:hypothetical protein
MKPLKDDELERALAQHPLKGPRAGLRERVLTNSRAAWSRPESIPLAGRWQISWAFSGQLAIAATVLFLLNLGVDRFNRNALYAQFAGTSMDAISYVSAVNSFAGELRQQQQIMRDSGLFYQ